jgi:hypothetical protein
MEGKNRRIEHIQKEKPKMPPIVSPIGLIETHFGNLRDPRALHIAVCRKIRTRGKIVKIKSR